jgi:predicted molibdopterin-dependent oxidoreductase YjgC
VPLSPDEGMNLNVMMKQAGKSIKGMFVMGEDIVLSEPNVSRLEEGLNKMEFLVLQDIFLNETARFADVILPAACFAEKDGVFTNSDRRVQRVRKAVEPPGEARADWEILCDLARAVGYPMPHYESPAEVYAELASLSPKFSGISHERLEENVGGLQWPCPTPDHPGTPTLHGGAPLIGKAGFQPVRYRPSEELPDSDFPLLLSTGRTLYHYNAATQTRRDAGPVLKQPDNFVEVNPRDARRLSVEDGEWVKVSSRRGEVRARVLKSDRMRRGCIWMSLHFGEESANRLTNDVGDAVTGTAEYKVCAAKIEKIQSTPPRRSAR